jgi:hypothetical protein
MLVLFIMMTGLAYISYLMTKSLMVETSADAFYNSIQSSGKSITDAMSDISVAVENNIFMSIESLFKDQPSHQQIHALEPTIVFALPKDKLEREAVRNVNIQMLYRKILEESLILSQIRADMLRFESAPERYAKLVKRAPQLVLRAPLVYIASYLQMTPETLSRVRTSALLEDK